MPVVAVVLMGAIIHCPEAVAVKKERAILRIVKE